MTVNEENNMNVVSRNTARNCLSLRFHPSLRRCTAMALLALVSLASTVPATAAIPLSERQVLIDLYNSAGGANWSHNNGWLGAVGTECTWAKVQCNVEKTHVVKLLLSSNYLVGNLPSSLSSLTNLTNLDVYSNVLTGPIPSLMGMTNLVYFLANSNDLTGAIPSLAGLTNLAYFDVHNNKLTGTIPPLTGLISLERFSVANNQLSGELPAVPSPNALVVGGSTLCLNSLNPTPSAEWDAATSLTPWYEPCNPVFNNGFE